MRNVQAVAVLNHTWGEQKFAGQTEAADRIPPLSGRLNIAWDNGGALRVDAWARFADAQDRLSARDVRDVRIDPNGTAGWGIIGASATWQPDTAWTLSVGVDNLLDKRYRNHGSGLDAPGRNLSVSVRRVW
jgi:outer membrane receptor protein involved in Fe transport